MASNLRKGMVVATITFLMCGIASAKQSQKPAFDVAALQSAIQNSQDDHRVKSQKAAQHRDHRATVSTKTGKRRVKMKVSQYGGSDNLRTVQSTTHLRGLGEAKELILKENTDIDFDSELQEVDVDPSELQEIE